MFETIPTSMPGGRYLFPAERPDMARVANTKKMEELFQGLGENTPSSEQPTEPAVPEVEPEESPVGQPEPEAQEPDEVPVMEQKPVPEKKPVKAAADKEVSVEDAVNGLFQAVETLTTAFQNELSAERSRTVAEKAKTTEVEKTLAKVRALLG